MEWQIGKLVTFIGRAWVITGMVHDHSTNRITYTLNQVDNCYHFIEAVRYV